MPDKVPVRTSSPVAGLGRARLTFAQVLAQSVSAVAPSAVMVTLPALVIPGAGGATIAVFVAAALLMAMVGYCVGQFAHRMVAVSGLYSYVVKGLGAVPGFGAGWSSIIGYGAAAMASVLGAASYSTALLGRLGVPTGAATVACLSLVMGAVALVLMIRGVRFSTRITLAVEVFAVSVAIAVLAVVFFQTVGGPPAGPTSPVGEDSTARIGFLVLIAITSFVGFESAGTVAREARNPLTAVPRAIRWTPVALGVLYVGAAAAQLSAPVQQNDTLAIVLTLPDTSGRAVGVLSVVMELGISASWFACVLGSTTALARILFAMGREGVAPKALGRTHGRFHTPHIALLAVMPAIVAVPVIYQLHVDSTREVLLGLLTVSAHGYVVAYIMVCIAAPCFLRRIGELTFLPILISGGAAALLSAVVVWATMAAAYTAGTGTAVYVVSMSLGFCVLLLRWRANRGILGRVGVYDETIAEEVVDGYRPWQVRR
ncbi:APC family permease [Rhodococcoides fascians]|uniref:APC family permease n=1 Tax=Rhodococcoides fascians TaxID=1828 RepID=UPI00050C5300|nr:APC family permease [Rhodococcus fascians]